MLHYKQRDFFHHQFNIQILNTNRHDFIVNQCKGKRILHIGCVDTFNYNINNNLHMKLSKVCRLLHGFDINIEGLNQLNVDCPSIYYASYTDILGNGIEYDIVIVPDVIEHVENVNDFITELCQLSTSEYIITAPDISLYPLHVKYVDGTVYEHVHGDHKAWYSPYTLYNTCKKLMNRSTTSDTCDMYLLRNTGTLALHIKG